MSKLAHIRQRLGALIAGKPAAPARGQRLYHGARQSRLTMGWSATSTSADAELHSSLITLRGRSRALVRDTAYAKRAREVICNNVIGQGIGLQAQVVSTRGGLHESINADIESAWAAWAAADACHTGATLHFADIERLLMAEVFEAGEVFVRLHRRKFGNSAVPLALEVIEAERVADDYIVPSSDPQRTRLGIEVDEFSRPVAYWIRSTYRGDIYGSTPVGARDQLERVPADDIIHLRVVDRWPQTRGVPWMHTVMRRMNDLDGYCEAEIVAARSSANVVGFIKSPELPPGDQTDSAAGRELAFEPGMIEHLAPGEEFQGFDPTRPNTALDHFMRAMLREIASGIGVSYESLSRDYSQSNYSSSRLSLLDDRDTWRVLQRWFVRNFREVLHKQWLQAAVLARAVSRVDLVQYGMAPAKFEAATFRVRGWAWVDPTKEVNAYKEAVRAGFMTTGDVIAATSPHRDLEDTLREFSREHEMMEQFGVAFDTALPQSEAAPSAPSADSSSGDSSDEGGSQTSGSPQPGQAAGRVVHMPRTA